jgi:hypothetical protein
MAAGCGTGSTSQTTQVSSTPTLSKLYGGVRWTRGATPTGTPPPGTVIMQGSLGEAVASSGASPSFYVPGTKVTVTYHYDCALQGERGYFRARLAGGPGSYSQAVASKTAGGQSTSTVRETVPAPGNYHLVVQANCPLRVSVATA